MSQLSASLSAPLSRAELLIFRSWAEEVDYQMLARAPHAEGQGRTEGAFLPDDGRSANPNAEYLN